MKTNTKTQNDNWKSFILQTNEQKTKSQKHNSELKKKKKLANPKAKNTKSKNQIQIV